MLGLFVTITATCALEFRWAIVKVTLLETNVFFSCLVLGSLHDSGREQVHTPALQDDGLQPRAKNRPGKPTGRRCL